MARLLTDTRRQVSLSGTTAHAAPYLAGTVIEDRLRPFAMTGPRAVSGTLQDRVVRQNDGRLCFVYRIYALRTERPDTNGLDTEIGVRYPRFPAEIEVEYRTDGLGQVAPYGAVYSGSALGFQFGAGAIVTPTALSRFMYVLPTMPPVTAYSTGGTVILASSHWNVTIVDCFQPVVP